MAKISLSEAIQQLRNELRTAILEAQDQDIIFTPNSVDVELAVSFGAEVKAGGGVKLLAFIDLSGEAKGSTQRQHKIKLSLSVADRNGKPLKVSQSGGIPKNFQDP